MSVADMKIYEPETIEDTDLPELTSWDEIGGKPETLSELDKAAGTSLMDVIDITGNLGDLAFEDFVTEVIGPALNTSTKKILGEFQFQDSGALAMKTDANNGLWLSPTGILGKKAGVTTFAIDTGGNATFGGSVIGATITGSTITGGTIQTAATGKRLVMAGSPSNEYQFYDDAIKVGHLKIDDDGAGGYFAEINIENIGSLRFGTVVGASESTYFEVPFFSASGRAAVGNISMGTDDYKAGLEWYGGYVPAWSFNMGLEDIVKIDSDILPNSAYLNLGDASNIWASLHVDSITLNGTTRTSWPSAGISSLSELSIDTAKSWGGYGISGLGTITSNANNSYNIGSSSNYWNNLYADFIRLNSTYGQIIWGSTVVCDFYSGYTIWQAHFDPYGAGSYNLGGATRYWNDISYKTLTDRGCLGWFDDGVELQDGRTVSDLEALKSIQKHPTDKTIYGAPKLDYKTMPKCIYKPASDHEGKLHKRDKDDRPYVTEEIEENGKMKKIKIMSEDGAETTALISIMLGAIKELDKKIDDIKVDNSK